MVNNNIREMTLNARIVVSSLNKSYLRGEQQRNTKCSACGAGCEFLE